MMIHEENAWFISDDVSYLNLGSFLLGLDFTREGNLGGAFRKVGNTHGFHQLQGVVIQVGNASQAIEAIEQELTRFQRTGQKQHPIGGLETEIAHAAFAVDSDAEGETAVAGTVPFPGIILKITIIPSGGILLIQQIRSIVGLLQMPFGVGVAKGLLLHFGEHLGLAQPVPVTHQLQELVEPAIVSHGMAVDENTVVGVGSGGLRHDAFQLFEGSA